MESLPTLLFIVVAGAAFYFLIIRPGRRRQQAQQDMHKSIAPGREVMTTAGVFGTVVSSSDGEIRLEIAPGVVIRIVPQAIAKTIDPPVVQEPPLD